MSNLMDFYRGRISSAPSYGFKAGHEILNVVRRCALRDSWLTDREYMNIINLCELAHIKMMEENFNAGWNDQQDQKR